MPRSIADITRRGFTGGLAALLAVGNTTAVAAAPALRIATLDYGIGQTLIGLGHPPIAIASAHGWDKWAREPALPPDVRNLGLSREINLEVLQQLAPDLILSTPFLERLKTKLERIAPVTSLTIHATGTSPMPHILAATRQIGTLIGKPDKTETFIADALAAIGEAATRTGHLRNRKLLLVSFLDARHLRVYGANSLFQDVLDLMGLNNAWTQKTNSWGFTSIGVDQLAGLDEAVMAMIDPVPPDALQALAASPIWQASGLVRPGHLIRLPTVLPFGTLPAATTFARLLAEADHG